MKRCIALSAVVGFLAVTAGCSTIQSHSDSAEAGQSASQPTAITMAYESEMRCRGEAGVFLQDEQSRVRIALGRRPTGGYGVALLDTVQQDGHVRIEFGEYQPEEGLMQAQMLTYPCTRVELPEDWARLTVTNSNSGAIWEFYHSHNYKAGS